MGWFDRKADLSELEERIEKLERNQRALESEWATWYEKAQRMLWRLVKRAEKNAGMEEDEPPPANGSGAKLDPVSQRILDRRRARGILPG